MKKTSLLFTIFFLISIIITGCGGSGGDVITTTSQISQNGIVGRAILEVEGNSNISRAISDPPVLESGEVIVQGTNLSSPIGEDGKFSIKGVTPGSYSIYGKSNVDGKVKAFWKESVKVDGKKDTNLGDVSFKTTGTIKGRILSDGQPVRFAHIKIMGQKDTTDSNGYYQVSNVPYGSYKIKVTKKGYKTYSATVSIGDVIKEHNVNMTNVIENKPVISGHVYYLGTKIPVSGVIVSNENLSSTTESDGSFKLNNILTGFQKISAIKEGYNPYSIDVDVKDGGLVLDIELTADVNGTLSGTVSDENGNPLYGVNVTLLNPDNSPSDLKDTTDNNGHYQITSVPQGTRNISFSRKNFLEKVESIYIADFVKEFDVSLIDGRIAPPANLSVSSEFYKVKLSWTPVSNENLLGYNIYRSKFSDSGFVKINNTLIDGSANSYVDSSFSDCVEYFYKISSVSSCAEGEKSDFVSIVPVGYIATPILGNKIRDIAYDGNSLFVTDTRGNKINKVDPANGNTIPLYSSPANVLVGLTYDGTNLLVVGYNDSVINVIDKTTGNVTSTIPLPDSGFVGLAWDGTNIWAANYAKSTIYKLATDGTVLNSFQSPGPYPRAIAWDGNNIICTDYHSVIYKIDPENGTTVSTINSPSGNLYGICCDGNYLWCADWKTGFIHKITD